MYDVIVVGAGPAGCTAAKTLCHSADYLEPFSSLYLKVLLDSNSVMARLNGGYPAK